MSIKLIVSILTLGSLVLALHSRDRKIIIPSIFATISIFAVILSTGCWGTIPPSVTAPPVTPPPVTTPPVTTPPVTTPPVTTPPVSNPQSPYGKALLKEQLGQASYQDWEKANIITDTYFARKSEDGIHKSWYTSTDFVDENTGYLIGLYYADGLLFFADAYHKGERPVATFYFWDAQMFACHDFAGGEESLSYQGSAAYNRVVGQFGDISTKALPYAQYAK